MSHTVTFPWSALCTDNRRHIPSRGRLVPSTEYRLAKLAAELIAKRDYDGPRHINPVELRAVAYFPDARKRDAGNYRKLIGDALTGIAYADDSLVWREVWERGPVDKKEPRLVVTIAPLEPLPHSTAA